MKALVTGGAGFIGSNLVDNLLADGWEVWVVDDLSTGSILNIERHLSDPVFRFLQDDIVTGEFLRTAIPWCDVVFHLAAAVGVRYIVDDPLRTIMTNVRGSENVLMLAHQYGKRTVIASTSEVYGKSTGGALSEDSDRVLGPTSINRWSYSVSKAVDEHLAYALHARGLPVSIVRFFNSFGPRVNEAGYGSVIANFIRQALSDLPITVHGDGSQTRCFTYVDDTVRGVRLAASVPEAVGEVFNIGCDREMRILDLAYLVRDMVGSRSEVILVPYQDYYGQSYEDTPRRRPDVRKAERMLGFRARTVVEEGLARTIEWCRAHYDVARPRDAQPLAA